jgi:hypothetical protein
MIQSPKYLVQTLLAKIGLQLTRRSQYLEPLAPFDVLELALLRALTAEKSKFYFVKAGSNSGILASSLNLLIRKHGLRGCFVEPQEKVFDALKRHYSDQPQLDFRNVMIGDQNIDMKRGDTECSARPPKTEGEHAFVGTVGCRMQTFECLVAELPQKQISMLYTDTDAEDDRIIEAAFRAGIFPPIINYRRIKMPGEQRFAIKMKLLDHGYRFIDIDADTVCLRIAKS